MTALEAAPQLTRILIIDDDQDLCMMLGTILLASHRNIESVYSISKATEYLQQHRPDIILLDQNLPDGKGYDFLRIITQSHPESMIIMMTSHTFSDEQHPLRSGASYFMPKPFTLQAIVQLIAHLSPATALSV